MARQMMKVRRILEKLGHSIAGRPDKIGDPYLLNAFASVFIGASTLRRGRLHILGNMVGVLLNGVIDNGLPILGVATFWQYRPGRFFSFRRSLLPPF
jgi:predicted ABC-type sugar transport system permease subunit